MQTDPDYDVPCTQACESYKELLPLFDMDDCVVCDTCGNTMIPNISTEDADGCGWVCLMGCEGGPAELEREDLEAVGVPPWLAKLIVWTFDDIEEVLESDNPAHRKVTKLKRRMRP